MEKETGSKKADKETMRLNRFLASCGVCSRREADKLILRGEVTVNGAPGETGQSVSDEDIVLVREEQVSGKKEPVVLAYHKPAGVTCSERDSHAERLITDMIDYPVRLTYAGRLDKDSQGLLLLTNEGDLVNPMMRSANAHEKEYQVRIDRPVTQEFLEAMARGVDIPELNTRTRPCQLRATGKDRFQIILTQGLNRQIRRMCETLGCNVLELKRIRIMNIHLGTLKTGSWRRMTADEYQEMLSLLNMKNN